ncbi:capping complex subunit for YIEGIA [Bacillus taeanensis]|uniref:Uncharacterized protein n=1 Tax=Bacillus taeanensis TaxID=273032 RepID=A0A366XYS5_9BACI|nr:hypothetical protein [Bacillus taeanensis]RBW70295.1 hypothetical protein DS031_06910 [Bacillus taeanensis]
MEMKKCILAVITADPSKVTGSKAVFICKDRKEMDKVAAELEAILDGISHLLSNDMYIIVKH